MRFTALPMFSLLTLCLAGWAQDPADDPKYVALRVAELVQRLATAGEPGERASAAGWLATIGPAAKAALPGLVKALRDTDYEVREEAAEAIVVIGPDASLIPDLVWVSKDSLCHPESGRFVGDVMEALVAIGEPAISALIELLAIPPCGEDAEWNQGGVAAEALGKVGRPAVPAVVAALKDPRRRRGAVQALGWMRPELAQETVPILLNTARDADGLVRYETAFALWRIGPAAVGAVPALAGLLSDPEKAARLWAINALGKIGPGAAQAVPELAKQLALEKDQPIGYNVRQSILDTLGAIGPAAASALPEIRALLSHPHHVTRSAAEAAIAKIEGTTCGLKPPDS